ncbi:MAG: isoprenyl transferase [Phycisphaerales bacterium]|nr:isoprenyl transferase [Phycisphaerales bacterium]
MASPPTIAQTDSLSLPDGLAPESVPKHIAIIMDGNGRWAKQQGLPRFMGHKAGAEAVRRVVKAAGGLGVQQITLFCFSSENWKRPDDEVNELMKMYLHHLVAERDELARNGIRLAQIGRRDGLPEEALRELERTEHTTAQRGERTLAIAVNYGGRQELTDAMRAIAGKVQAGELKPEDISEDTIASHLYTKGMPDPDLVIRSAGEMRLSNFLLWQISYAELYVTPKLWPDFQAEDLVDAIKSYAGRTRRYGGLEQES